MSSRGLYNKLLELRETKDLAQFYWSTVHKSVGIIEALSADTVSIKKINSLGEDDGIITFPTAHLTHIIENSLEIKEIKQFVLQKSFRL